MDVLRQVRLEAGHRGEPLRGAYPGPGQPACYGPHMTKRLPDRAAAFLNAQQMPQMSRRRFLESLAAGTALSLGAMSARSQGITPIERPPDPTLWAPREILHVIADPSEALSVFDFEAAMMKKVSRAHFGYMATGIDDEATVRGNREGFQRFQLRPRRLVDVSSIDTSCEIFGVRYDSPIVIAPTGSNKAFHADGEVAVARAAKAGNHLQILSTVATTSIEDAIAARGAPVWFQLYPTERWEIGDALARRAEKAGCETIVLTVDTLGRQKWETYERLRRADIQQCGSCHAQGTYLSRKPNFDGLRLGVTASTISPNLTWEYVKRLRGVIRTRLVLKGILAAEDARLAVENGIDGIIVSNHGGRAEDGSGSTIEALPEVVDAVGGRIPVLIDSGFRRGTEIVKALAIGARAVCVGRPYLWGLGSFGQAGVDRVLQILRSETRAAMQQAGAPTVKHLVPGMVRRL
jgi:4-hydroxymandelate oxidase